MKKIVHQFSAIIELDLLIIRGDKSSCLYLKSLDHCLKRIENFNEIHLSKTENSTRFSFNSSKLILAVSIPRGILLYKINFQGKTIVYDLIQQMKLKQTINYLDLFQLSFHKNEEDSILIYSCDSKCYIQNLNQTEESKILFHDLTDPMKFNEKTNSITILRIIPIYGKKKKEKFHLF